MMKSLIAVSVGALSLTFSAQLSRAAQDNVRTEASAQFYQHRYALPNIYDKLIDNHGDGYERLYGLRNMRAVLNGVVYRGGANNVYNKHEKRRNSNPLPTEGLQNLCEEGFSTAVYLYSENYGSAPKHINCQSIHGEKNSLDYHQESVLSSETDARAVLKLVHERLTSKRDQSPIYLHCWKGWHASGYISTLILRQFCGFSGSQGVAYWNKNTDGNNSSAYEGIRKRIRAFQPDPSMQISADLRAEICPGTR